MPSPRSYRSKLEVLRDFLRAAQEPAPKTRIIGAANLNPLSFGKYLRICADHDLITSVAGGYMATPRASPLLQAIDGLILKTGELEAALLTLERSTLPGRGQNGGANKPFRQVLRRAWTEIALRPADRDDGHPRPPGLGPPAGQAPGLASRRRPPRLRAPGTVRPRRPSRARPAPGRRVGGRSRTSRSTRRSAR
jgi:predicted transcriptional regulator